METYTYTLLCSTNFTQRLRVYIEFMHMTCILDRLRIYVKYTVVLKSLRKDDCL